MADIKERKKDTSSIKEKHTSVPKELLKQETIHSIQWARQQVQEAAEPEQQETESLTLWQRIGKLFQHIGSAITGIFSK